MKSTFSLLIPHRNRAESILHDKHLALASHDLNLFDLKPLQSDKSQQQEPDSMSIRKVGCKYTGLVSLTMP